MISKKRAAIKYTKMKNRKEHAALIKALAAIVVLMFIFSGCSASDTKVEYDSESSVRETTYYSANNENYNLASTAGSIRGEGGEAYGGITSDIGASDIKKIIKSGEIAVEVKDVDDAYSEITEIVKEVGGEEFSKYYSVSGNYKRMELVLKIPPANLDLFEKKLKELVGEGKIKSSNIRSNDITSQYYDYKSRLDSYTASRDQLRELLKKAETVEDTLKIHSELTRIQAEIDSMQGQINMWDKLVDMATITLYIDEEDNPMKMTETASWEFNSAEEIWSTMKNGFINVINWLYNIIVWLIIIIVSISPVLIVGILLYIFMRKRKKRRQKGISTTQKQN